MFTSLGWLQVIAECVKQVFCSPGSAPAVVDAVLRLRETFYLGEDQWTGVDC